MSKTRKDDHGMLVPVFAVLLGFVWLGVGLAAGDTVTGIGAMLIMFVYAGVLLALGSPSQAVTLRGNPQDERQWRMMTGRSEYPTDHRTSSPGRNALVCGHQRSSAPVWLGLTAFNGLCQLAFTFYYSRKA